MSELILSSLSQRVAPTLARWYAHHHRALPWRTTQDPYRIWLSEIILQQTRVAQGLPYYERFVATFPTVQTLAAADEPVVLRLWQGLGYYSRARNLHQTARYVADVLGGQFPTTYQELLTLKGVGTYTAAAIASFAFGERVAVVDGNVYRVLARLFGLADDITQPATQKKFANLAQQLIQFADDPAIHNQGMMEFGAIQCTPVSPDCLLCPFQADCAAFQTGRQHLLPVKAKKAPVRERFFHYVVLMQNGHVAMKERSARDIWQGLYDFPLVETDQLVSQLSDVAWPAEWKLLVQNATAPADRFGGGPVAGQQLLSHQRISAQFFRLTLPDGPFAALPEGINWYAPADVASLPKPVLINTFLEKGLHK